MNKIRLLQVIPSLSQSNGVDAFAINYFKYLNKNVIDTFFLVLNDISNDREEEIIFNGGHIIKIYFKKIGLRAYLRKLKDLFINEKFDIVHCNVPLHSVIILNLAKKYKVPVRILHSHTNRSSDSFFKRIMSFCLMPIALRKANVYFACSEVAGKYLFKKKNYTVINNAVNIEDYKFSEDDRNYFREKLNISKNEILIGEFARFCDQKNQLRTIEIFNELFIRTNYKAKLLLVGHGNLREKILEKINELELKEKVIVLNDKKNINKYYSALDAFLMPSKYEGLGMVLIEAQINGLNTYTSSDVVPKAAKITPSLHFVNLNDSNRVWCDKIIQTGYERNFYSKLVDESGFSIEIEAQKLLAKYIDLLQIFREKGGK